MLAGVLEPMTDIVRTLKRAEVFLGLSDSELEKIAALPSCREESYEEGEVIFNAGDSSRAMYVLKEGQVDLTALMPQLAPEPPSSVVVDRITTGDFFGWSALVGPHSRVFSAVCKRHSEVIYIHGGELLNLFEEDHRIGYKFFQSLSSVIGTRLRYMEQALLKGKRWPLLEKQKGHPAG
jgi:CRP-like cAMP-binding protein